MLFDPVRYQSALATRAVGRFFIYRERTETTMSLARREADEGAPHGTVVFAEEQTAGRGRKGRSFSSPASENIYFTVVLRPSLESHRRLPLAVPVAVCTAVRAEGVDARIKWPNDIWVGERKLSGMLIDAELTAGGALAMPGIGINVNGDPTLVPELAAIATSIAREVGHQVGREPLLARICNELERTTALDGAALAAEYRTLSMVLGRPVTVTPIQGAPYEGIAAEISDDGCLVVERQDGGRESLNAADVSLRPMVQE